ncbi:MAG: hypothetical protein H0T57_03205 [Rubrobacter sp.]|nr:hypothetical protein [Rubrobacter sp.]
MSLRRRLEAVEGRIRTRASPGGNRSPEEAAERERQFEALFTEIDTLFVEAGAQPPQRTEEGREDPFEELFELLEHCRAETDRKEQR